MSRQKQRGRPAKPSGKRRGEKQAAGSPWENAAAGRGRPARRQHEGSREHRRAGGSDRTWIGTVSAHPDGFGFVAVEGREQDIFLPPEEMRGLMHGDRVEVREVRRRGREAGELVRLLEHAPTTMIAQLESRHGVILAFPRSKRFPGRILISQRDAGDAKNGDWVRIDIKRGSDPLRGRVLEVLGSDLTPKKLIDLVITELDLPGAFPDDVLAEAAVLPETVGEAELEDRLDLRNLPFVTIDGEDARDFDDAICVLQRGDGFEAWVAIADVSHYVRPGSALDQEALARSNSFYFPDRVIPMLPEKLSNGLCSLNPGVPRLAMAVRMRFDANGKQHAFAAYNAIIHSQARLTYTQAARWLDDRDATAIAKKGIRTMLDDAAQLFRQLLKLRKRRGALDLDMPEVRALLEEDYVHDMKASERNTAHRLIEEMMLAANTGVAELMEARDCALLYRVHSPPEREAIQTLNEFLAPFGLFVPLPKAKEKEARIKPSDVEKVLELSEGKPFAHVLHRLVLRSMQQAKYTPDNDGHFGLAYKTYCHFTSPIRRYADLTVHRRLKALVLGHNPDKMQPAAGLADIGDHTSVQERKQQRAEWDTQAMLAALYHSKDVGKTMPARIAGLTKRRIFVELEPSLAEGAINVDELSGLFVLDDAGHRLTAKRGGLSYALGDRVNVVIDSTDPVRGQINVHLLPAATTDAGDKGAA